MNNVDADRKSGGCGVKESSRRGEGSWSEGRGGRRSHCEVGCKSLSAVVVEAVLCDVPTVLAQSCFQGDPVPEGPPRSILLHTPPSFPGLSASVPLISASQNLQRPIPVFLKV